MNIFKGLKKTLIDIEPVLESTKHLWRSPNCTTKKQSTLQFNYMYTYVDFRYTESIPNENVWFHVEGFDRATAVSVCML